MKFYVITSFFSLLLILSATTVNAKSKVFTDPIEACYRHHHGISGFFLGTKDKECAYTPRGTDKEIKGKCEDRKGLHMWHKNECVAQGPGASGASSSMALTGASTGMAPTDASMMADTSGGMGGGVGGVAGAGAGAGGGYERRRRTLGRPPSQ
ncbi:hypothetical protein C8R42DRAFT_447421 [Lentinula raphanica]|nr:hypothetical protein C8R42DRAFT_447421 [Lentinula raphanica]